MYFVAMEVAFWLEVNQEWLVQSMFRNWENTSSMLQSTPKYFISIELNKSFTVVVMWVEIVTFCYKMLKKIKK